MKVFVVSERDLFNIELQEKIKKYGEVFFLNKDTYVEDIISKNKHIKDIFFSRFDSSIFSDKTLKASFKICSKSDA